jgi:nitroimidazol reductase NimA-like FMN-containing flavoprotein (pyridoxamine 5'-phosphate oxidase superfamily)
MVRSREAAAASLTSQAVWDTLARASFAVVSHVTPAGQPRSSGVVYAATGHRLYAAVAADSWKARHIAANGRVALTVPVRRGGLLSLLVPSRPPPSASTASRSSTRPTRHRLRHCPRSW